MKARYLAVVFGLGLGLIIAVLCQINGNPALASAAPAAELHVCPSGCAYSSVQAAVDAASEGDVVKVATGTYSDLHVRPRADVTTTGVVTQVVYVSKTLSIQGGYTTSNWTSPDPEANPTTLDALGQGRALYISGDINPTVEGLRLTGGDATGQGGWPDPFMGGDPDTDAGGGLYVISATATLKNNQIQANTTPKVGGGAALLYADVTFRDNVVSGNTAEAAAGMLLFWGEGTLSGNTISGNTADMNAGIELFGSPATLEGNTITANTSLVYGCAGVRLFLSRATLRANTITANTSVGNVGGGLCAMACDDATLDSNLITDNEAGTVGSGMHIEYSNLRLSHNTIARNGGGEGNGIYIRQYDPGASSFVIMTNTIVADQDVGIEVTEGCTLTGHSILWYNTPITITQPGGTIPVPNQITGDPAFVDPDNGDYHIGASSPARDAGVDAGVHMDLDGEWRPMAWAPDLGADEYPGPGLDVKKQASHTLVNGGQVLTYTVVVTSVGEESATGVALTDTLDAWQRPVTASASQGGCTIPGYDWGGAAICTPGSLPPDTTVWMTLTAQVSTSVTPGQELANTVIAQGDGMAAASAGTSVLAQDCHVRINDDPAEYTTVQAAVDAASPGDVVKVAGTCLGVNTRAGHRQQVYLDKSLTIQGGYTTSDWTTPDPEANPTTLDARGQGHLLYVTEPAPAAGVNATVAGLELTGGDTSWIDGDLTELCGGGVHVVSATITLEDNRILGNQAWWAGGLCLLGSEVTLRNNDIEDNTGAFVGGLHLGDSHGTLSGDTISGNRTTEWSAGGLDIQESQVTLDGIVVRENSAARSSGGLLVWNNSDITMTNSVVADNYAAMEGGGLRIGANTTARLVHTTVARNSSGGSGIYMQAADPALEFSSLAMTNTILADQSVGIRVTDGCTLNANGILWHNTPVTVSQSAAAMVTVQNQHTGDAGFAADGYHLLPYSTAIDRGVDAGVSVDIDGEARPVGAGYDLGADEDGLVADLTLVKSDQPDPGVVGQPLTYTLAVGNNGPVGATGVVVTETLPAGATFVSASAGCERVGGLVVCTLGALAPDEQRAVSVHLTPDSTGQLIDLAVAQAVEPDPNPANDADCELTAIAAAPVLDPALTGISPDHGPNDGVTAVTIEGQRFQDGATATLDGTSLGAVTFVDAQHLQATVPAGLTPGSYDLTVTNPDARSATLPGAFSVLAPGGPTVTSIAPGQGPIDMPVTVDIRGLNFSSEMTATLDMAGSQVELPALIFVNSSRLFGTVPVSITPGVYTLTVSGPGGVSGALPEAYEALAPEVNDDLYALETDLWLDPPTVRQGETPRIGLTLRRQGGEADLSGVQVEFYLEGGTPAFATTAPVLAPAGHVTVTVDWTPSPGPGEQTLYAVIDPLGVVEENDESNNVVSRTVTVLPPLPDTTPPVVESVSINDGALVASTSKVSLKVEASDNPGGSGVVGVRVVGYIWIKSRNAWWPVPELDRWLPFNAPSTKYTWTLYQGANYIQVWAADAAGNISVQPGAQIINCLKGPYPGAPPGPTPGGDPRSDRQGLLATQVLDETGGAWIPYRDVHLYRMPMEVGQRLQLHIATAPPGAICVGVWAPNGDRLWWAHVPEASEREFTFEASQDGTYQIEVEGASQEAYYEPSLVPLGGTSVQLQRALANGEAWRTEPIVPPWDTPSRYVGVPSAPLLQHYIYLPLVLRLQ